ncbi:MAG: YggS family pyridoxal phosphate-dependent enzyme [Deltaproteobacteria bacterium]|nr:YggS family pyridoxal phosphate-dependent enzyme [Deltaproteobacteria bacterium]MBW2420196.1 YggS family pyridoxal phosphate-dependent enzyme [Deltaproteobacteria bacterium]
MEAAARSAGRRPEELTLVGVSKRQPTERVVAALRAGLTHLGENYVQEAQEKRARIEALLGEAAPPRWHMIGGLQRNKARSALEVFDCVETVDRPALARELDKRAAAAGRRLDVLLQVNLSREEQKGGVLEEALPALLESCAALEHLCVTGLMTIPAATDDPEQSRPVFRRLRALQGELRDIPGGESLRDLSMGMSSDFEVAIQEGATLVRVGTAIFGPRQAGTA